MELFAIVASIPVAFVATAIYVRLVRRVLAHRATSRIALWISVAVIAGLLLEWGALATLGAVRTRGAIGPGFYPIHMVLFVLAVPALANILIIKAKAGRTVGSWFAVALLCSMFALPVVLTQYGVAEALYGVDGVGGPYGNAPTISMPSWW
jgi:hypothetical protein